MDTDSNSSEATDNSPLSYSETPGIPVTEVANDYQSFPAWNRLAAEHQEASFSLPGLEEGSPFPSPLIMPGRSRVDPGSNANLPPTERMRMMHERAREELEELIRNPNLPVPVLNNLHPSISFSSFGLATASENSETGFRSNRPGIFEIAESYGASGGTSVNQRPSTSGASGGTSVDQRPSTSGASGGTSVDQHPSTGNNTERKLLLKFIRKKKQGRDASEPGRSARDASGPSGSGRAPSGPSARDASEPSGSGRAPSGPSRSARDTSGPSRSAREASGPSRSARDTSGPSRSAREASGSSRPGKKKFDDNEFKGLVNLQSYRITTVNGLAMFNIPPDAASDHDVEASLLTLDKLKELKKRQREEEHRKMEEEMDAVLLRDDVPDDVPDDDVSDDDQHIGSGENLPDYFLDFMTEEGAWTIIQKGNKYKEEVLQPPPWTVQEIHNLLHGIHTLRGDPDAFKKIGIIYKFTDANHRRKQALMFKAKVLRGCSNLVTRLTDQTYVVNPMALHRLTPTFEPQPIVGRRTDNELERGRGNRRRHRNIQPSATNGATKKTSPSSDESVPRKRARKNGPKEEDSPSQKEHRKSGEPVKKENNDEGDASRGLRGWLNASGRSNDSTTGSEKDRIIEVPTPPKIENKSDEKTDATPATEEDPSTPPQPPKKRGRKRKRASGKNGGKSKRVATAAGGDEASANKDGDSPSSSRASSRVAGEDSTAEGCSNTAPVESCPTDENSAKEKAASTDIRQGRILTRSETSIGTRSISTRAQSRRHRAVMQSGSQSQAGSGIKLKQASTKHDQKKQLKPELLGLRLEYYEETTDIKTIRKRGRAIFTKTAHPNSPLCFVCASVGKSFTNENGVPSEIHCASCAEMYHTYCIDSDLTEENLIKTIKQATWTCQNCNFCEKCSEAVKSSRDGGIYCTYCRRIYHKRCLGQDYPCLPRPGENWVCIDCVRCTICDLRTPGLTVNSEWKENHTMCELCYYHSDKNNCCTICDERDHELDREKWMQCSNRHCKRWTHYECENLTDELYAQLNHDPHARSYCMTCDGRLRMKTDLENSIQQQVDRDEWDESIDIAEYVMERTDDPRWYKTLEHNYKMDIISFLRYVRQEAQVSPIITHYMKKNKDFRAKEIGIRTSRAYDDTSLASAREVSIELMSLMTKKDRDVVMEAHVEMCEKYFPWFDFTTGEIISFFREKKEKPTPPRTSVPADHGYVETSGRTEFEDCQQRQCPVEPKGWDARQCRLCKDYGDGAPADSGRLLFLDQDHWIHVNCALWSAEVWEMDVGVVRDVDRALTRGRLLKCDACGERGATVGCHAADCLQTFHFRCGRNNGCYYQTDKRSVFCKDHRDQATCEEMEGEDFIVNRRIILDASGRNKATAWYKDVNAKNLKIHVGCLTIDNIGRMSSISDQKTCIVPIDYRASRLFWSTKNPNEKVWYKTEVTKVHKRVAPVLLREVDGQNSTICHDPECKSQQKELVVVSRSPYVISNDVSSSGSGSSGMTEVTWHLLRSAEVTRRLLEVVLSPGFWRLERPGDVGAKLGSSFASEELEQRGVDKQHQQQQAISPIPYTAKLELAAYIRKLTAIRSVVRTRPSFPETIAIDAKLLKGFNGPISLLHNAAHASYVEKTCVVPRAYSKSKQSPRAWEVDQQQKQVGLWQETDKYGRDTFAKESVKDQDSVAKDTFAKESVKDQDSVAKDTFANESVEDQDAFANESVEDQDAFANDSVEDQDSVAKDTFANESVEDQDSVAKDTFANESVEDQDSVAKDTFANDSVENPKRNRIRKWLIKLANKLKRGKKKRDSATVAKTEIAQLFKEERTQKDSDVSSVSSGSDKSYIESSEDSDDDEYEYLCAKVKLTDSKRITKTKTSTKRVVGGPVLETSVISRPFSNDIWWTSPTSYVDVYDIYEKFEAMYGRQLLAAVRNFTEVLLLPLTSIGHRHQVSSTVPTEIEELTSAETAASILSADAAAEPPVVEVDDSSPPRIRGVRVGEVLCTPRGLWCQRINDKVIPLPYDKDDFDQFYGHMERMGRSLCDELLEDSKINSQRKEEILLRYFNTLEVMKSCGTRVDQIRKFNRAKASPSMDKEIDINTNPLYNLTFNREKIVEEKGFEVYKKLLEPWGLKVNTFFHDLEIPRPTASQIHDWSESRTELHYRVTSTDGFKMQSFKLKDIMDKLHLKVHECKLDTPIHPGAPRPLCFTSKPVNGYRFIGIDCEATRYVTEQLPGISKCTTYKPKYNKGYRDDPIHKKEKLVENKSGCARSEPIAERQFYNNNMNFMSSRSRDPPDYVPFPTNLLSAVPELTLPETMQFRELMRKPKKIGIYHSNIHGTGLFVEEPIREGEMICEYTGEIIRKHPADRREKIYEKRNIGCYLFRVRDDMIIDATNKGNMARFINHSCNPNCNSDVVDFNGKPHIVIKATKHIAIGEEMTYDYKFALEEEKIPCLCKAEGCRRYLN